MLLKRLRREVVRLLEGQGARSSQDCITPATGWYRTSPYSDCYRWEVSITLPEFKLPRIFGCWETMTDFVRNGKQNGIYIDHENREIGTLT